MVSWAGGRGERERERDSSHPTPFTTLSFSLSSPYPFRQNGLDAEEAPLPKTLSFSQQPIAQWDKAEVGLGSKSLVRNKII